MGNFARGEAGFFISMIEFTKVPKEPKELVELLRQRGLVVRDAQRAERYLSTIGYYRLSGYFAPFECEKDTFCHEVEFQDVLNLYIFDRKLRLHIMDAIERIEIAIRSVLSHVLCMRYGSHWYLNKDNKVFKDTFNHQILIKNIELHTGKTSRAYRNSSCRHYYEMYNEPATPPAWMVIEVLSIGTWSKVFEHLKEAKSRRRISKFFSFNTNDFGGWLHVLTFIRNTCAHHNRFWNHIYPPTARNIAKYTYTGIPLDTPYANVAMIQAFLSTFTHSRDWIKNLRTVLAGCPVDIHQHMKFPENWTEIEFWKISA